MSVSLYTKTEETVTARWDSPISWFNGSSSISNNEIRQQNKFTELSFQLAMQIKIMISLFLNINYLTELNS